jgi:Subtilase family
MGLGRYKRWLVLGVAPAAVTLGLVPVSQAIAAGKTVSATPSVSTAKAADGEYVVILRNQNTKLGARSAARRNAVRAQQAPVTAQISGLGARVVAKTTLVNAVVAKMSLASARKLAANPAVAQVIPNQEIPGPALPAAQTVASTAAGTDASRRLCGTATNPQLNPEALYNIKAIQANELGYDGAGITVATIADGINAADPDYQRNPKFASSGSPAGSPVVKEVDFTGDPATAPTDGVEMNIDAGSIAAQGNTAYDLSTYVSTAHPLPAGCDIKIQGDAPGANVLALKAFAEDNETTSSGLFQAINYAVNNGAKVINESFGSNNIPDLADDVIDTADNAAVAAGVTVVVSSGDAGVTGTLGPPGTDPNVISVGASTTFRAYAQDTDGGINAPGANGRWVDNNISGLSSGGVSQSGNTVDLVAPGDLNWITCDSNTALYLGCTNENGVGTSFYLSGGTSESSPLTAGAAADVIQAYAEAHGGTDPTPALVKQILMSSATDIGAPATQQGAGLLNIEAAVKLARSIGNGGNGGNLLSPNQVDVTQFPHQTTTQTISITNTSSRSEHVSLSTRALTRQVGDDSGSFCMQPGTPTTTCPANTGSFAIWSGVTEVYQIVHFHVPHTHGLARLSFSADYPYSGQSSVLHIALLEPNGTYAGYSLPQGLADYGNVQVAHPRAGNWTAVFFTELDGATGAGSTGTSGTVQWDASTSVYQPAAPIWPSELHIGPGQTRTATVALTSPSQAGDTGQSIVISNGRHQTTIPVVVRTAIRTRHGGGSFSGVLTGGNGRAGFWAQANYYVFNVRSGVKSLHAEVNLANDPGDAVTAYLIDPSGQNLGYSTNVTLDGSGTPESTLSVDAYHVDPQPGQWTLALQWAQPVTGAELSEPFSGTITYNENDASGNLPDGGTLTNGKAYTYDVTVHNNGQAPEAYFVDPRLTSTEQLSLLNQNAAVNAASIPLPEPAAVTSYPFPYYFVPTQTSQLQESLTSTVPVDFDSEYFPGDPDIEGVTSGDSASATITEPEVSPGFWTLNASEIGPYPATGAPSASGSASVTATTRAFDPAVSSSTGDLWSAANGVTSAFSPVYVPAGGSATIQVTITPSGSAGSTVSGTLFVDDVTLAGLYGVFDNPDGDELAAIPYSYTIGG